MTRWVAASQRRPHPRGVHEPAGAEAPDDSERGPGGGGRDGAQGSLGAPALLWGGPHVALPLEARAGRVLALALARPDPGPALHPPRDPGPGWHGPGARRLRLAPGSARGPQAASPPREGREHRGRERAPDSRGPGDGSPQPPSGGVRLRLGLPGGRLALHRHGVRAGPDPAPVAEAAAPLASGAGGVPGGGTRAGRRARRGPHPPRLQARQRAGGTRRARARHGLRPGPGSHRARPRGATPHAGRGVPLDHLPRTSTSTRR
jgi:hypothetical protein